MQTNQLKLRVIAGSAKGIKLNVPEGARPITDRARTTLFDVIGPDIIGKSVLDLFAGSGCLGIEALSRGAKDAVFVDQEREAFNTLKGNIQAAGFTEQSQILQKNAFQFIKQALDTFDIVFVDPPYPMYTEIENLPKRIMRDLINIVKVGGAVIIKHPTDTEYPTPACFELADQRNFGNTTVTIWVKMKALC